MKLDASERVALINLLSDLVGSYDTMHTLRRVRGLIGFKSEEMEMIKQNGGSVVGLDLPMDVHLDDWTNTFIQKGLKRLSDQEKMPEQLFTLYEKFVTIDTPLPEQDPETAEKLREQRRGKKTVAIVGFSPISCSLAPFGEKDVEIWGLNEAHAFGWMKRATRWFQIHDTYKQKFAKRGVTNHYDWLKKNEWGIPIYMIHATDEIPNSLDYPLQEVCSAAFGKIRHGDDKIKYFCSSFDYMMGVAYLDYFKRIEVYGFDMANESEYAKQKPSAEFWLGLAAGSGVEIYLPDGCQLLKSNLYGGKEQGEGWQ